MSQSDYKYTVIVSQLYHSRHSFIVKFESDKFMQKAKAFVTELEHYKRAINCERETEFGDLTYKSDVEISGRYNVNDYGDIYFINTHTVDRCTYWVKHYLADSIRQSKGYKKKALLAEIEEHHNFNQVHQILMKYFELA